MARTTMNRRLGMAGLTLLIVLLAMHGFAFASEITVVHYPGPELDALKSVIGQFTSETGIGVNIIEISREVYNERIATQLMGRSDAYDIVALENAALPALAAGGFLEQLDAYVNNPEITQGTGFDLNLFLGGPLEASKYEGRLYALPTDASGFFLFYRKDLIADPPETWEEYIEVAKAWTRSYNSDSPTVYGASMLAHPNQIVRTAMPIVWSYGGDVLDEKGNVTINSPEVRAALDVYASMLNEDRVIPRDSSTYEYMEVIAGFQEDVIAMAVQWNAAVGTLTDPSASPTLADKIGVALIPGVRQPDGSVKRHSFTNVVVLAVNAFSKNKENAARFLTWLTGQKGSLAYTLAGGITPVVSVMENPELIERFPWIPVLADTLDTAKPFPALKEWGEIYSVLQRAFGQILSQEQTSPAALAWAEREISFIVP